MYKKLITVDSESYSSKPIIIEANILKGMFAFSIFYGLQNMTSLSTKIQSILKSSLGVKLPNAKLIVNIQDNGEKYTDDLELPIIMCILSCLGIYNDTSNVVFSGRLNLDGSILPVTNPYKIMKKMQINKLGYLILSSSTKEIVNYRNIQIKYAKKINDIVSLNLSNHGKSDEVHTYSGVTFNDILGQKALLRALIISVVGRHHVLVSGVSGIGKTLAISSIESIFPCEDTKIIIDNNFYNYDGRLWIRPLLNKIEPGLNKTLLYGKKNQPGIFTKSKNSFIFFDEFNNNSINHIKNIATTMEEENLSLSFRDKKIVHKNMATIIAAINPCPCGNYGSKEKDCKCQISLINRYKDKLPIPIIDRFHIKVQADYEKYSNKRDENFYDLENIRKRISKAWSIQKNRYNNLSIMYNSRLSSKDINEYISISSKQEAYLIKLINHYKLSLRTRDNILRVARSISDFEGEDTISDKSLMEAINYQIYIY